MKTSPLPRVSRWAVLDRRPDFNPRLSCSSLIDKEETARALVGPPSHLCIRFFVWLWGQPAWAGIQRCPILSGFMSRCLSFLPCKLELIAVPSTEVQGLKCSHANKAPSACARLGSRSACLCSCFPAHLTPFPSSPPPGWMETPEQPVQSCCGKSMETFPGCAWHPRVLRW